MRITPEGRLVSVRGRHVRMTCGDVVMFLRHVAAVIPGARFFDVSGRGEKGPMPEISEKHLTCANFCPAEVAMVFVDDAWQPDISPKLPYRFRNYPRLNASIRAAEFWPLTIAEVGREVTRSDLGLLNANHYADGADGKAGKRIIDKLFRVHRKLVDNKVVPVDLRTGEIAGKVETDDYWHGADMARRCLDNDDHYLAVRLDRENDRFWGYKPVSVPGA